MKILYLVTSLESGGAEFAIPDIVTALMKAGQHVDIVACEPRDMMAAQRLEARGLPYTVLCKKRRLPPMVLARLLLHIHKQRPDVIWTSLSHATRIGQRAGQLLNIPVISFKHSAAVKKYVYRMRYLSSLWISDSALVADYLRQDMHIPADRIMEWPLYQATPSTPMAPGWHGQPVIQLGSVGRLHEVKNYDKLIQALSQAIRLRPDIAHRVHLTILGEGPERSTLEALVDTLGLKETVSLPGHSDRVDPFLNGLHIYFQPSRYEGMCLAVHEAMNAGLPVVATPVGELVHCVSPGRTGFMAEGELIPALVAIIHQIVDHPEQLARLGKAARHYVQSRYSPHAYQAAANAIVQRLEQEHSGQLPFSLQ